MKSSSYDLAAQRASDTGCAVLVDERGTRARARPPRERVRCRPTCPRRPPRARATSGGRSRSGRRGADPELDVLARARALELRGDRDVEAHRHRGIRPSIALCSIVTCFSSARTPRTMPLAS
jgi:hypothetical protein